ncbi:MAG TPA: hypothetical protein PLN53_01410 [Terricaulis sp.]|nr:hypothetical protein [Terricaulis sp.]
MVVLKRDGIELAGLWFTVAFIGLITLGLTGFGLYVGISGMDEDAAFPLIVTGGFMAIMTLYVAQDALARSRTRIAIDDKNVMLRLPSRRGHVRFAPVNQTIARADIAAIEHRTETFNAMAKQETYVLALRDGSRLILGSDKQMIPPFFGDAARALANQGAIPVRGIGVVEAKTGFMLMWGASVPPWQTAPMPEAKAARVLAHTENFLAYSRWIILASLALSVAARAWG